MNLETSWKIHYQILVLQVHEERGKVYWVIGKSLDGWQRPTCGGYRALNSCLSCGSPRTFPILLIHVGTVHSKSSTRDVNKHDVLGKNRSSLRFDQSKLNYKGERKKAKITH